MDFGDIRPRFLCSRGLDVLQIDPARFAITDPFGCSAIPFNATSHQDLLSEVRQQANIVPLTLRDGTLLRSDQDTRDTPAMPWSLEEPYVARIPDYYRIWLCGRGDFQGFDASTGYLPLAYLEAGFGGGGRDFFQEIHGQVLSGKGPYARVFTPDLVLAHLHHIQLKRICDDLLALTSRALGAFGRVLRLIRDAVRTQSGDLAGLGPELIHIGALSYEIATNVTVAVISATSSLDVGAKLIGFINETKLPPRKFRGASGHYFSDLPKFRAETMPESVLQAIKDTWKAKSSIPELIQWRHDLVHSTTALEIERLFIGMGTGCINGLPLHYAQLHMRDVEPSGQPHRFLGRDYFTSQDRDLEVALHTWLADVIAGHSEIATLLRAFIDRQIANPIHHLAGT
jgi:hypothetical protein